MHQAFELSSQSRTTAGALLLSLVAVEWGGFYMLHLVRGREEVTPFQLRFSRAGHAHAGVLVILGLVCQPYADASGAEGLVAALAHSGVPLAAILMSAGFFFSSAGEGRTEPSRLVALVYLGAASLAAGVIALGASLLTS